jgi:hypothetical protein
LHNDTITKAGMRATIGCNPHYTTVTSNATVIPAIATALVNAGIIIAANTTSNIQYYNPYSHNILGSTSPGNTLSATD